MRKSDINAEVLRRYAFDLDLGEKGKVSKDDIDRAAKEFGSKIGSYPAFPDTANQSSVRPLFDLRANHYHRWQLLNDWDKYYKLITLSNIDHSSFNATLSNQFGGNPFNICYIAENIGSYKPNLNNFKYLLDHAKKDFDIEQGELCHVAQGLSIDHSAARSMGIRSPWIDRYDILRSSSRTPDDMQADYGYKLRVRTLMELADIVDQAFGEKQR